MIGRLYELADRSAHFNDRGRHAWVAERARTVRPGSKVLDVGAGSAQYRRHFAHCTYQTQDFAQYSSETTTRFERPYEYTKLDYVSDAAAIPVPDGTFDAILCTEVLEHVSEPIKVVKEIGRILKPGGRAFLSAPLQSALHMQPYHFYGGFTPQWYERFLPDAGMRPLSIKGNGHFFALLAQETSRAGSILIERQRYRRWHPLDLVVRYGLLLLLPIWYGWLDQAVPVPEFTGGYLVEAVRE